MGRYRGAGPEILLGHPGDEGGRVAAGRGLALTGELEWVEAGPLERPGGGQRHVQDHAEGEIAVGAEVAVAGEVAEAVGDRCPR